jgi:hypothetical protein
MGGYSCRWFCCRCSTATATAAAATTAAGLLFAPYAQELAAAVNDMGWTLIQAQLTSSYQVGVLSKP